MGKMFGSASIFVLGVVVGSLTVSALSMQVRTQKTTRLMTTDLTGWCEGKEIIVDYQEEGPGQSAKHYHPGYSFSYMIEGSRTVKEDGAPPQIVRTGGIHFEAPMKANISENAGPAKVVTFRIVEKGKPESVQVP